MIGRTISGYIELAGGQRVAQTPQLGLRLVGLKTTSCPYPSPRAPAPSAFPFRPRFSSSPWNCCRRRAIWFRATSLLWTPPLLGSLPQKSRERPADRPGAISGRAQDAHLIRCAWRQRHEPQTHKRGLGYSCSSLGPGVSRQAQTGLPRRRTSEQSCGRRQGGHRAASHYLTIPPLLLRNRLSSGALPHDLRAPSVR